MYCRKSAGTCTREFFLKKGQHVRRTLYVPHYGMHSGHNEYSTEPPKASCMLSKPEKEKKQYYCIRNCQVRRRRRKSEQTERHANQKKGSGGGLKEFISFLLLPVSSSSSSFPGTNLIAFSSSHRSPSPSSHKGSPPTPPFDGTVRQAATLGRKEEKKGGRSLSGMEFTAIAKFFSSQISTRTKPLKQKVGKMISHC